VGDIATDEIFSCEMLRVWIFVNDGSSQSPNTPLENPTTRRLEDGWKVVQTTFVCGRLK
jgi:hypothetical protein